MGMEPTDLAVGTAAEHLVCFDLLMAGYRAFLADQNCPYDVAVELSGRLIRIQVKSTRKRRPIPQRVQHIPAYMWHVRRAGKRGARCYADGEFDALALVALDIQTIAYLPPEGLKQTIHIRAPGVQSNGAKLGKQFADYPFEKVLSSVTADDPLLSRRVGDAVLGRLARADP